MTSTGYSPSSSASVRGVCFHPDGSLLASIDAGGAVVCWDLRCGTLAWTTARGVGGGHVGRGRCLAWSPCGVQFASGGEDGVVQLCDARMLYRSQHTAASVSSASSATNPATPSAVSSHDATNTPIGTSSQSDWGPYRMLGHTDAVTSVSFYLSPHHHSESNVHAQSSLWGRTIPVGLVTTSLDGTLRLWDGQTGRCVRVLATGAPVYDHCRPGEAVCLRFSYEDRHTHAKNDSERRGLHATNTDEEEEEEARERSSNRLCGASVSSILTVGRSKYWSLWDRVNENEEEEEEEAAGGGRKDTTDSNAAVMVCETEAVMTVPGRRPVVAAAAAASDSHSLVKQEESETESESEDEMSALRRRPVDRSRTGGAMGAGHR